jgi:DNA-binding MarR family transcriptional regulator
VSAVDPYPVVRPTRLVDPPEQYVENGKVYELPLGVKAADVRQPACRNGFAQVCVRQTLDALDELRRAGVTGARRGLVLELVMRADEVTGVVEVTQHELAREWDVEPKTMRRWLGQLEALRVIETRYVERGRGGSIRFLNHDQLRRLSALNRIEEARRRLVEEQVVERETTVTRERITTRRYVEGLGS